MKATLLVIVFFASSVFPICNYAGDSGLIFQQKKFHYVHPKIHTDGEPFGELTLQYPDCVSKDKSLAQFINRQIQEVIRKKFDERWGEKTFKEISDDFMKRVDKEYAESTFFFGGYTTLKIKANVVNNIIVSISVSVENYARGTAHPQSYEHYINVDLKKRKILNINDIVTPDHQLKLTAVAAEKFAKLNKDVSHCRNKKSGVVYTPSCDEFSLATEFFLSKDGLHFWYNNFEIASYAEGTTELFIKYDEIKDILNKEIIFLLK